LLTDLLSSSLHHGAPMDSLAFSMTTTKTPLIEAAASSNLFDFSEPRASEPLKVQLLGSSQPDTSEDESESTAAGTRTPDTRASSMTAEQFCPAFVSEDELEAIVASTAARDTHNSLDSSAPAFIPECDWMEDSALGCSTRSQQELGHKWKTLSIRNIPQWYTPVLLLAEIRDGGFRLHHDFDYFSMPHDYVSGLNLGYCVLSFPEESVANAFQAAFHERTMRLGPEDPALEVGPATPQDLEKVCTDCAMMYQRSHKDYTPPTSDCPQPARFCHQCGTRADYAKFNFCSQCGASLAKLREQPVWS